MEIPGVKSPNCNSTEFFPPLIPFWIWDQRGYVNLGIYQFTPYSKSYKDEVSFCFWEFGIRRKVKKKSEGSFSAETMKL